MPTPKPDPAIVAIILARCARYAEEDWTTDGLTEAVEHARLDATPAVLRDACDEARNIIRKAARDAAGPADDRSGR